MPSPTPSSPTEEGEEGIDIDEELNTVLPKDTTNPVGALLTLPTDPAECKEVLGSFSAETLHAILAAALLIKMEFKYPTTIREVRSLFPGFKFPISRLEANRWVSALPNGFHSTFYSVNTKAAERMMKEAFDSWVLLKKNKGKMYADWCKLYIVNADGCFGGVDNIGRSRTNLLAVSLVMEGGKLGLMPYNLPHVDAHTKGEGMPSREGAGAGVGVGKGAGAPHTLPNSFALRPEDLTKLEGWCKGSPMLYAYLLTCVCVTTTWPAILCGVFTGHPCPPKYCKAFAVGGVQPGRNALTEHSSPWKTPSGGVGTRAAPPKAGAGAGEGAGDDVQKGADVFFKVGTGYLTKTLQQLFSGQLTMICDLTDFMKMFGGMFAPSTKVELTGLELTACLFLKVTAKKAGRAARAGAGAGRV